MERYATFSNCRKYRYTLWRGWSIKESVLLSKYVMFIGLNPSTADEENDDPTIRRCIGYARSWGYDGLVMVNLFAFRATNPKDLKKTNEPVGTENDTVLLEIERDAAIVVAAWGTHGSYLRRDLEVQKLIPNLHCLHLTKNGCPGHPLYLPKHLKPLPWKGDLL